jgi:hypothetical protein
LTSEYETKARKRSPITYELELNSLIWKFTQIKQT